VPLFFYTRENSILGLFEAGQTNSSKPSLLSGQEKNTISGASILSDLENDSASMGQRVTRSAPRRLRMMLALLASGCAVVLLYQLTSRPDDSGNSETMHAAKSARTDSAAREVAKVSPSLVSGVVETTQAVALNNEESLGANLPGLSALIVNEQIDAVDQKAQQPPADAALNELVAMQPDPRIATNAANSAARAVNKTSQLLHVSNAQKKRALAKANARSTKVAAVGKSPKKSTAVQKSRSVEADSDVTLIAAIVAHDNAAPATAAEKPAKTASLKKIEDERNLKLIDAQ
jgi:ribosomal 50S subunit-recycling heat shock protein